MRRLDEIPVDPDVAAALDAIDATLAGEPVDPSHAELAELALLLAADRPQTDSAFVTALDERVRRRFAKAPAAPRRRSWLWSAGGLASAVAAAVVVIVVLSSGSSQQQSPSLLHSAASSSGAAAPAAKVPSPAAGRGPAAPGPSGSEALSSPSANQTNTPAGSPDPILQPAPNGRKVIQGGELSLTTAPSRIDAVAQEVFDVVGREHGIVSSSNVTATGGPGGYAQFQLSIPSSALPQTMAALSSLPYARVASRTDTTQDVNDKYNAVVRALADARALRTSLLKQLAGATTQAQIDSLMSRIHDAEASISSDQATLRGLNNQIDYSQVTVTINGGAVPVPAPGGSGGFTLRQAAHDAGRVLMVAAGVALIALAALVPIALIAALAAWIAAAIRRRRREQALDLV
jgi:hypothetical protein